MLDVAAHERIIHLPGYEARPAVGLLHHHCLGGEPCWPIGETEIANLARTHSLVERGKRLYKRGNGIGEVTDIYVDPVGPQPLQTGVERRMDVTCRKTGLNYARARPHADLGGDDDVLSLPCERAT